MTEQELKLLREKLVRHKRYLKDSDDPSGGSIMLFDYITDVQVLLSHIDHLETIIGDRMEDGAFLMQAGAAEERAMVVQWMTDCMARMPPMNTEADSTLAAILMGMKDRPRELLPPQEARVEVERLRVENEALRKDKEKILNDLMGSLGVPRSVYQGDGPGSQLSGMLVPLQQFLDDTDGPNHF